MIDKILEERQKTHGDFYTHAVITQKIKFLIRLNKKASFSYTQEEALDMIAHKIGRITAGNPDHIDHWDDIAGYATLVANELREKKEKKDGHAGS